MKRIVLAGEAYSRNLGDQAIHACLKWLLEGSQPGLEVVSQDISGRQSGFATTPKRGIYQVIRQVPGSQWLQPILNQLRFKLSRARHTHTWSATLAGAQALVIGGGQLLMDNALDFPLKVGSLAGLAERMHIPVYFSACGVGGHWSRQAKRLFEANLRGALDISLRDGLSARRLEQHLPGIACSVSADPAILAGEVFGWQPRQTNSGVIGLGVMDRQDANSQLPEGGRFTHRDWMELWSSVVTALSQIGFEMRLFSTGSSQDEAFLDELFASAREVHINGVERVVTHVEVTNLLETLSGCQVVVGTRLHASILANAIGIPSVGLTWDEKVKAYYQEAGLESRCLDIAGLLPGDLAQLCSQVGGEGFPPAVLGRLKDNARRNAIRF